MDYSPEEYKKVIDFWNSRKSNPPDLSELVSFLSNGESSDIRFKPWGPKIRAILLNAKIKAKDKSWEKVENIELTDDQKTFIRNNIKDNKPYQIAKDLFGEEGKKIAPLGREVRAINKYLDEIGEYKIWKQDVIATDKYEPPNTFHEILKKVNVYLHAQLSTQNITAFEKKALETTIQFLHSPRFIQEINNYQTHEKRISFESEFVRAVYGKIDLTPEEVSLTINWCSDIIQAADIRKLLEQLHNELNNIADDDRKYSQSLAVTIGEVTTNLNEVLKRQERIYGLLNKSRAKRDDEKTNKVANLAALFEAFREEENRKKAIKQAELLKEARKNEINRQETLSDVVLLCLGMDKNNI